MRFIPASLFVAALLSGLPARAQQFQDNFDSYAAGVVAPQGGWAGWDNVGAAAGAVASPLFANSAPHSFEITGANDMVNIHTTVGATYGQWVYRTMTYVPGAFTGQSFFILLNTYAHGGGKNWSCQVFFDSATNRVRDFDSAAFTALVRDTWVELRVEIDLDNDTQKVFYNGVQFIAKSWSAGVAAGGAKRVQAVNLYANNATPVYYDDMSLRLVRAPRLVISEVVDGPLVGGQPKLIEVTNTGTVPIPNMEYYSIGNFNNGATTMTAPATVLNAVALAPGDSYTFAYEASGNTACGGGVSCFQFVYGSPPDQFAGGGFINGDDAMALFIGPATGDGTNAILNDVYGVIGQDGTGTAWDHEDGYSFRCGTTAASTFDATDWGFGKPNALETASMLDPEELVKTQKLTNAGSHTPGCGPRTFCTAKMSSCGGTPVISSTGTGSATATSGFLISSTHARANKIGIPIYGNGGLRHPGMQFSFNQGATVFGYLCIGGPPSRGNNTNSGGSANCDGAFTFDMNAFASGNSGGNPQSFLLLPGNLIYVQWWGRDNFFHGDYLSGTLEYTVRP